MYLGIGVAVCVCVSVCPFMGVCTPVFECLCACVSGYPCVYASLEKSCVMAAVVGNIKKKRKHKKRLKEKITNQC